MPTLGDLRLNTRNNTIQVWGVPQAAVFAGLPFPSWQNPRAVTDVEVFEVSDAWGNGYRNLEAYRNAKRALRQQLPAGTAFRELNVGPKRQRIRDLEALVYGSSMLPTVNAPPAGSGLTLGGLGLNNPSSGGFPLLGGLGLQNPGGMSHVPSQSHDYGTVFMPGDGDRTNQTGQRTPNASDYQNADDETAWTSKAAMAANTFNVPKKGDIYEIQAATLVAGTATMFVKCVPVPVATDPDAFMDGSCVQPRIKVFGTKGDDFTVHYGARVDTAGGTNYVHNYDGSVATGTASIDSVDEESHTIGDNGYALVTFPESWWRRGGVSERRRQIVVELGDTDQRVKLEAHQDEERFDEHGFKLV